VNPTHPKTFAKTLGFWCDKYFEKNLKKIHRNLEKPYLIQSLVKTLDLTLGHHYFIISSKFDQIVFQRMVWKRNGNFFYNTIKIVRMFKVHLRHFKGTNKLKNNKVEKTIRSLGLKERMKKKKENILMSIGDQKGSMGLEYT